MKRITKILLCVLLLLVGAAAGYFIAGNINGETVSPTMSHKERKERYADSSSKTEETSDAEKVIYDVDVLAKAEEMKSLIDNYFVGEYDSKEMGDAVAEAMISATGDRWSYYISADEYSSYLEQMNNSYVGIGVTIQMTDDGECEIIKITRDSPAYNAGVHVNDILTHVEGNPIKEWSLDEIKAHVRGEENTSVNLTFRREEDSYTVDILRATIDTEVALYELINGHIGYITIANFDSKCAQETLNCIETAFNDGADSLIFDVRFNPGGYKNELVDILDYLLPEGELFRMRDYAGKESVDYSDSSCVDVPIAVLINEDSYSAAEFFAAALQEYEAAVIVGAKTCGKGYFQYTYLLSDGSAAAISSGTYYTPKGVSLAGVGIIPDVPVDISDEEYMEIYYGTISHESDSQLQAAIETLENELR